MFQTFRENTGTHSLISLPCHSLRFARLMKLQLLLSYAYASTAFETDGASHEKFREFYDMGVDLAEAVLKDKLWAQDSRPANYCFDSRVVMPLWMAGIHCRDDKRRAKATRLLLEYPRREGIWDSVWAGKLLKWVAGLEETFRGEDGLIPNWARIRDLKWTTDFEKRTSVLSCRQDISGFLWEIEEKTTCISW